MTKPKAIALNRRRILAAAGAATAALAAPRLLRAQTKELVVGGAASHKTWVETMISRSSRRSTTAKSSTRARARS